MPAAPYREVFTQMKTGQFTSVWRKAFVSSTLLMAIAITGCDSQNEPEKAADTSFSSTAPAYTPMQAPAPTNRIDMLKAQLFSDPNNARLLGILGDALFESQRYAEAIGAYEKSLSINPNNADDANSLALAYFYTGDTDKAITTINSATEADPTYKHAWLSKGFIMTSYGHNEEAVMALNKVKELDPGGALAQEADKFLQKIASQAGE